MLIKNAEIYQVGLHDLRIERDIITEIGRLSPQPGEPVVDAAGHALLPGLNDHHIHFLSYAASLTSIDCGPATAINHEGLAALLQQHASGDDWLRGVGYHESVAGDIDCRWLDRHCPDRPARIQHRTGRLWIFNSAGLELLRNAALQHRTSPGLSDEGFRTGRFYDADRTLAALLGRQLPPVKRASQMLASYGVTGFSDMTPSNDQNTFELFRRLKQESSILQDIQLARNSAFDADITAIIPGPVKIHLHENRLPELQTLVGRIRSSHLTNVAVAIHCVTEIELLFSLVALEEAGALAGDRIEHASITPEHALDRLQELGVTVVTQPHFILEKGDTYLREVDATDHEALYRCRTLLERNIPLAGSSDAPFGTADPWTAMRTAVTRLTSSGQSLGNDEALSPEQALALFLGELKTPGQPRKIHIGAQADLCLLASPWKSARLRLSKDDVRLVLNRGKVIFSSRLTLQNEYEKSLTQA